MTTVSREMNYLSARRQVEDTRRLRSVWEACAQRERSVRRWPQILRVCAAGLGLLWLAGASWWLGPVSALCGLALMAGAWIAAEWRFRADRLGLPLGWELDRLNPQYEGAFSLLELLDDAATPARAQMQPVLDVTLARIDWSKPVRSPDRVAEKRRALGFASGLLVVVVLGLLLIVLLHTPAAAQPEGLKPGCTMKPVLPPAVVGAARTPQIKDFRVRIEPPAYTRLPVEENNRTTIQAPAGSRILLAWRVEYNGPVQTWVQQGDRQVSLVTRTASASAEIAPTQPTGPCAIVAQSGALDARLPLFLQWQDDRPPRVETTIAAKVERDREGVRFELHTDDDYGLTRMECIVSTQPATPGGTVRVEVFEVPLPAAQGDRDAFHGRVLIPNAVLDRLKQDRLRLQVKAYDTHTAGGGANAALAPNVGASEAKDFLVVQPWDNARKPRSLDRKSGADGDQNNPSDDNQGGGGGANGNGPQNNQGPRMLQKKPDDPPGPAGPQQDQASNSGEPAKYSPMAGSQGDAPKTQNDAPSNPNPSPAPPKKDTSPNAPPEQPSQNPADGQKNETNPNRSGGTPSTDGAKNPEPPPPTNGASKNATDGGAGGSTPAGPGQPPPPPGSTPEGDGAQGNAGKGPGGGGAASGPKSSGPGVTGSNDTAAGARGNATADEAVLANAAVSVEDALNFARQKPLGAWQRAFGGTGGQDRFTVNDTGAASTATGASTPAGSGVNTAGAQPTDNRRHMAADRQRINVKYAERIEQYLLRARGPVTTVAPIPSGAK